MMVSDREDRKQTAQGGLSQGQSSTTDEKRKITKREVQKEAAQGRVSQGKFPQPKKT